MKITASFALLFILGLTARPQTSSVAKSFESDRLETGKGPLVITFIGHGTLMLEAGNKVIHVDPVSREADYSLMPKGDIILVTHEHGDHLDPRAIAQVTASSTKLVVSQSCSGKLNQALVFKNGDEQTFGDITVKAIPAYNIVNMNKGRPFHPKGNGNGYLITFGGKRIYVAGDTENIPEMADLKDIDIAFLPMNLPYTMTPQMVAEGAKSFQPGILYPYHMGETDPGLLAELLKGSKIELRIRKLK